MLWSACHSLYAMVCLSLSLCHGLPVTVSLYAMVCLSQSVCHGRSVIVNLYASVSLHQCMSWSVLSQYVMVSLSQSVIISMFKMLWSVCHSQSVIINMLWSVGLHHPYVMVSLSQSVCLLLSVTFTAFVLSVFLSCRFMTHWLCYCTTTCTLRNYIENTPTHMHARMHTHTHTTQTQKVTVCSDHFVTTLLCVVKSALVNKEKCCMDFAYIFFEVHQSTTALKLS